jgi:hypothetical protein
MTMSLSREVVTRRIRDAIVGQRYRWDTVTRCPGPRMSYAATSM